MLISIQRSRSRYFGQSAPGLCDRVSLTNLLERSWIDCFDHPFCIKREAISSQQPERMFSRAGEATAIYKLSNFVAKSHPTIDHSL